MGRDHDRRAAVRVEPLHQTDEFELMVKNGMTPASAIAAATVNAADLLGLSALELNAGARMRREPPIVRLDELDEAA